MAFELVDLTLALPDLIFGLLMQFNLLLLELVRLTGQFFLEMTGQFFQPLNITLTLGEFFRDKCELGLASLQLFGQALSFIFCVACRAADQALKFRNPFLLLFQEAFKLGNLLQKFSFCEFVEHGSPLIKIGARTAQAPGNVLCRTINPLVQLRRFRGF